MEQPPQVAYFDNKSRVTAQNKVIIRIWMPHLGSKETNAVNAAIKVNTGVIGANVGHISLETPDTYASMWPHPSENVTNAFKLYKSKLHSLADDIQVEGPCDLTICLYSLNIQAMEAAFSEVKELNLGYVLSGDFSAAQEGGQSCCSLANSLLCRGGISQLGTNDSSISKIVSTPDDLARFVKTIKAEELRRFSFTRDFPAMNGEYFPPNNDETKIRCSLI